MASRLKINVATAERKNTAQRNIDTLGHSLMYDTSIAGIDYDSI